jgi:hypothetical protein
MLQIRTDRSKLGSRRGNQGRYSVRDIVRSREVFQKRAAVEVERDNPRVVPPCARMAAAATCRRWLVVADEYQLMLE